MKSLHGRLFACLILAIIAIMATRAGAQNLEFEGAGLLSSPDAVKIVGNYAYCAYANGLVILDITAPSTPNPVGQIGYEGPGLDIEVRGDYAYIAMGGYGMQIFDISDPAIPCKISKLDTPGYAVAMKISGDYAYIADLNPFLVVASISDPRLPAIISSFKNDPYISSDISVCNGYAYMTGSCWKGYHNPGMLSILSLENPSNPVPVGSLETMGPLNSIDVDGKYAFITARSAYAAPYLWEGGLVVFDITNLGKPYLVTYCTTKTECNDIAISGNRAFVTDGSLKVFDISIPSNPLLLTNYNPAFISRSIPIEGYNKISIRDTLACISSEHISILNISNPSYPRSLSQYGPYKAIMQCFIDGDYAYLRSDGFSIADVSDPVHPRMTGRYGISCEIVDMFARGDYAYLATEMGSLVTLDITDRSHPTPRSVMEIPATDIFVSGNKCYTIQSGLFSNIDITNPDDPEMKGSITGFSAGAESYISGNYAFVADSNLKVIDIADQYYPALVAYVDIPHYGFDIAVQGNYAFIMANGLLAYNISDPNHPTLVNSSDNAGNGIHIIIVGRKAFIANWSGPIDVTNITIPWNVAHPQNCFTNGMPFSISAQNGHLYVAKYSALLIYSY